MTDSVTDTAPPSSTWGLHSSLPTTNVSEVLRRVAHVARDLTGAYGAYVEQVVDGEVEVVAVVGEGAPPLSTRIAYPGSVTEEIAQGGLPVTVPELGEESAIVPYLGKSCASCGFLLAPLMAGEELLGALVLLSRARGHFGSDDIATLRSLSELASVSLRLVGEISREREERTALLDSTGEGIYGIDPAGQCTFMNRSGAALLGYSQDEVLGTNLHRLIHHTRPDGSAYEEAACPIYDAARAGKGVRVENEVLWRSDGSSFPAEYASHPIREDDRILGAVVTFRDISERKREEQRRAHRLERERFLAEASAVLASSLDYETTLDQVARLAVPRMADSCVIDVLDKDERLNRVGVAHIDPGMQRVLATARPHAPPPDSGSPALAALEGAEPVHVPVVTDEWIERVALDPEHLDVLRSLKPRSVMIVPLLGAGRTVGLFWLARTDPDRPYDADELALAVELGRRAGVAVDNAMLFAGAEEARGEAERRAREEAALREAIQAVAASASTEEVIHRIAGSAVRATNADGAFVERIEHDCAETLVVASAGETAPAVGGRLRYEGSFTEYVVERAQPLVVPRIADAERGLPGELARARPDDAMLILPLVDGGEPIGSLYLMRRSEKWQFREDEVQRALAFAELAALAFRKIHMLEDSERRREEIQRVMESRARLMRGFSHDVKNPLGAADGFLQLLQDQVVGPLTEKQAEHLRRARRSIHSSLDLIEDLLDLARAEAGQLEIEWGPVDLRDATRELAEEYRTQADRKGIAMHLELPDELPVIRSDATRVRQVLGNLLSNAVKYTDEGRIAVRVDRRSTGASGPADAPERAGEWVVAEVKDTGPGIPANQQRRLFEEFTRLDPGEKSGAGVGLAISQRISHALGGEIAVSSEPGEGSVFTLWLPRAAPDGADD